MSNYIHRYADVITYPNPNPDDGWAELIHFVQFIKQYPQRSSHVILDEFLLCFYNCPISVLQE